MRLGYIMQTYYRTDAGQPGLFSLLTRSVHMTSKSLVCLFVGIGLLSLVAACAVNPAVQMKEEFWSQTDRSVVVALANLPEAMPHKEGPQGLLDLAINNAMADQLSKALKTITLTDSYGQTRSEVVKRMQEKGMKSSVYDKTVDANALKDFHSEDKSRAYASKDFRPLKAELDGADRVLLFTVVAVGTQRSYYGFIPTSRPTAVLNARGEIIDLETNEILWRQMTTDSAAIDDPWDEPPEFSNVHAAVQNVILAARQSMVYLLFANSPAGAPAAK